MSHLNELLKNLNFTQYEGLALETLIKYNVLGAHQLYKYSGVPQPKIYETMIKLQHKGFIDIIPKGRKKIYQIKPKEIIQEKILEYIKQFQNSGDESLNIIEQIYGSEEAEDVPFIGIAGEEMIQDYLYSLIDTAKESIIAFIPSYYYNKRIISLLNVKSKEIDIILILFDTDLNNELQNQLPDISLYKLKTPSFEILKNVFDNIQGFLRPDQKESYTFNILRTIVDKLKDIFGLMVIDRKKSFFRIPLPITLPMAILSTTPELLKFHNQGINEILKSAVKIN